MKDIELAEGYYYKTYSVTLNIGEEERKKEVIDIFLAGLKAGRPQWHDLRKNPNDLPNDDRVVSDQKGENVRYVKHRNKWFYLDRTAEANVIAWCEIPTFDKE